MKPDEDSKTASTDTADQLTTHLISLNPPQSQITFLLMITLLTTSLELIKSNRDSVRKVREADLIGRGKTLKPLGMNEKYEM